MSARTKLNLSRRVILTLAAAAIGGAAIGCEATNPYEWRSQNQTSLVRETASPSREVADTDLPVDDAWARLRDKVASERKRDGWLNLIKVNGLPMSKYFNDSNAAQASKAKEAVGGQMSIDAFEKSINAVAEWLARELPASKQIVEAQRKQILTVSPIENRSKIANPGLDLAMRRLNSDLTNKPEIRNNFLVLGHDTKSAAEALASAGAGKPHKFVDALTGEDPIARTPAFGGYHPDSIYEVTGKFYQVTDEPRHRMYLKTLIEVWKPRTGETIRAGEVTREYRFHPYRTEWISAEEDDALRRAMAPKATASR